MGRSGFDWRVAERWLPTISAVDPRLRWSGIYTHLHSADDDPASVDPQARRLAEVLARVADPPADLLVHVLNSAGVFRAPAHTHALVRPGIFLYGGRVGDGQPVPEAVASVHARVVHLRDATPGTTLGYGATYAAQADERWATLSIGYGDGLPRALGNKGSAIVDGVRCPIIGRISMDVTVVNITGAPGASEGSVATFIGTDGGDTITVDDVAGEVGSISYEVLTGLTPRLPRVWSGLAG
jgi:alanine racemase